MGLFNGVKIGDRVELKLTEVDVIDRGKDKNGVYLQTVDNRFYEDQETLQEVKVKERGTGLPTRPGSIIRAKAKAVCSDTTFYLDAGGNWQCTMPFHAGFGVYPEKFSDVTVVFDAGKVSK